MGWEPVNDGCRKLWEVGEERLGGMIPIRVGTGRNAIFCNLRKSTDKHVAHEGGWEDYVRYKVREGNLIPRNEVDWKAESHKPPFS